MHHRNKLKMRVQNLNKNNSDNLNNLNTHNLKILNTNTLRTTTLKIKTNNKHETTDHQWYSQQNTTKTNIWNNYRTHLGRLILTTSSCRPPVPKLCFRVRSGNTTFTGFSSILKFWQNAILAKTVCITWMFLKAWFANPGLFLQTQLLWHPKLSWDRGRVCKNKRGNCLTANGATVWAMTQIGHYTCVKSLQAPNMCLQVFRNLKHTPPSLMAGTDTQKSIGAAAPKYFACASSLKSAKHPSLNCWGCERVQVCKTWQKLGACASDDLQLLTIPLRNDRRNFTHNGCSEILFSQENPIEDAKTNQGFKNPNV